MALARRSFLFSALALSVMASGCGFHLRGQTTLPFETLYVDMPVNDKIAANIRRLIAASTNVTIVPQAAQADAILELVSSGRHRDVVSVNMQGEERDYELTLNMTFRLVDPDGNEFFPPTTFTASRTKKEKTQGVLSPLWVIVGEEPLLALEAGDALRDAAKELGYSERVVLALSSVSDWSPLIDAATSVSLFDDKKIIELRFLSSGPGIKGAKVLAQFAELVPQIDSTVTVVHLTQADYTTQKASWFKALAANGNVISCQPIARAQYPNWIRERLRRQGQSMQESALTFFAEQTEGNLMAAKQELMKLELLYPGKELTLREVEDCVMNVSRYSIEDLLEAIAQGDVARTARTVNGMQSEDEPMPFILVRLSSFLRDTLSLTVNRQAQVMPSVRQLATQLARRSTPAKITNMLARCADLDRLAKGLTVQNRDDVWSELKTLCVFLAHVSTRK